MAGEHALEEQGEGFLETVKGSRSCRCEGPMSAGGGRVSDIGLEPPSGEKAVLLKATSGEREEASGVVCVSVKHYLQHIGT